MLFYSWVSHLQDEEHGSSDGQRQDIKRICCRQVWKPECASSLKAGHWQIGHLPQCDEEGDKDRCLRDKSNLIINQILIMEN